MASPTASGNLLAGRYRVLERIGSGGMATVYLAEDERLARHVAVKRLHAGSPDETAKRFAREARIGASLNHENVVTVFDTVTEDESVVIVMEYVDGESLADALRRGRIEPGRAVEILRGVAAALDHAHMNGIVHRDVKPANILLGKDGRAKLVDLGIATAVEGTRITRSGSVMGTAAYMAPEQLDGMDTGPHTDIYALAAVAYEMLAGRPAYRGGSPIEVAHQVVNGPPPDLSDAWPEAPRGAVDAIERAMAFRPEERPESATAFAKQLDDALRAPEPEPDPPTAALPIARKGADPFLAVPPRPAAGKGSAPELARPRDRSFAPLLALLALAAVGGIVALLLLSGGDGGGGESQSSRDSAAEQRQDGRAAGQDEQQAQEQPDDQGNAAPAPEAGSEPAPESSSGYQIPEPSGNSDAEGARLQLQGHNMLESDPEGAVKVLERSVEAFPPGTDAIEYQYALFSLGKGLRLSGRPEDAIPVLELRLKHPNQRDVVQRELDAARAAAGQ